MGGDHAIGIGTIQGVTRAFPKGESCLLWIDAHADINTMQNSESGNMHGMSVSFNMEQLFKQNSLQAKADWLRPRLQPRNMAYIGLRCVDPAERKVINDFNIPAFSMAEVDQLFCNKMNNSFILLYLTSNSHQC